MVSDYLRIWEALAYKYLLWLNRDLVYFVISELENILLIIVNYSNINFFIYSSNKLQIHFELEQMTNGMLSNLSK